jgi:two-component system LytT family sensor kinase
MTVSSLAPLAFWIAPLNPHEPLLVNTIGHFTGALLFGVFLFLLLRGHARVSRLSLAAAALAFLWNLSSLLVLAIQDVSYSTGEIFVALGTSALSLLPAVLLHVSLGSRFRPIVLTGYSVSVLAVIVHASEHLLPAGDWHRTALLLTTAGFAVLTSLAALLLLREGGRSLTSRLIGAMSLFLFSLSLVHIGAGHAHMPWSVEMLVHHAGVPLALIVLLQDYRFLLLDTFARILASFLLSAILLYVAATVARFAGFAPELPGNPFWQGVLIMSVSLLLLVYAVLRSQLQQILTRVLFGRSDLDRALAEIRGLCSTVSGESAFIEQASRSLAAFLGAEIRSTEGRPPIEPLFPAVISDAAGVELIVPLRFSSTDVRYLLLGPRRGGRRYLSEDLRAVERIAAQIVEHVEHLRAAEMRRLVTQAELRALESQIHPHFLFNALNTLYGVIPRAAADARRTVLNLADVLRYALRSDKTFIPLAEELRIVEAYLEIESLRLGPRLRTEIDVPEDLRSTPIPVLSLQPLVENAVKHAVSARQEGGLVRIRAAASGEDGVLISVEDTGPGFSDPSAVNPARGHGVALANVARRLDLCYGPSSLHIQSSPAGARVQFVVPVGQAAASRS